MSQCFNPNCLKQNANQTKFCQKCGSKLLLAERYRALRILGQGGFGRTFLAVDEHKPSQPPCVIKQFFPQAQGTNNVEKASELFAKEAVRLDELGKHTQIPELMAYFTQDERQYLVQEFIDGQNLAEELEKNGAFNEQQVREFLNDLLSVLQFVHSNQVIHRDIKPENIIRRRSDNKLVLVDFGAAKFAAPSSISVTGTVIGDAEYIAPEQARGKPKFASDLYSLGVTCIHFLTQISPFELFDDSENDWVWRQYLTDNPVSDELGQILDKLIESATKNRFQSASEVLEVLKLKPDFAPNSLVGTWCGNFGTGSNPATLLVTYHSGDLFKGDLIVHILKFNYTYIVEFKGNLNEQNNTILIRENRIKSEHFLFNWRLGNNEGTLSSKGYQMSGRGKDLKDSYYWSFVKVDYEFMTELLAAGKWKEADRETGTIMLKVSRREKEGYLNYKSIKYFPQDDLCKIDQLWVKYSNGRFGFSIQKRIWENNRNWKKCGYHFGWRENKQWKKYSQLNFTLNAPSGAFPTFWGGEGRRLVFGYSGCWENFFSRLESCGL